MLIHPHARSVITQLQLPAPIKESYGEVEWDMDLSKNTNAYLERLSCYPDVKQENLKKLYLSHILDPNNTDNPALKSENLLFTVGSMEGIDILLRTFCELNQDKICVVHPSFPAYEHSGLIHNLEVKKISLTGENLDTFPLEEMIKINPKMVFLPNPNNPVGTILEKGLIEKLCESIDGFVVVDEAYIEFSSHPSSLSLLGQYKNLIILRTLSKAWGLAGVRCGIIVADELIISSLQYVQLPYGFSIPAQDLVHECLNSPGKIMDSWKKIKNEREKMAYALSQLPGVEKVFKSETNFLMIIVKDLPKTMELLMKHKIKVLDCSLSLPNALRISLGTEEQNRKVLEVMG